jgi:transcriptional regulator with XRE-family HTH domain
MITSEQIRMARAALRLGVRELGKLAKLSPMTITRLENDQSGGYARTLRKIQEAFESQGVEFTNGDAPGVRLHKKVLPKPAAPKPKKKLTR